MKAEKTIKSIIMLFAVVITTINSKAQEIIYEKADSIFIEAQTYALDFYKKFGFGEKSLKFGKIWSIVWMYKLRFYICIWYAVSGCEYIS